MIICIYQQASLTMFFCVQGIDLKLKNVSATGVYGWNSICETVAAEWLEDISKNQVPISACTTVHLDMLVIVYMHIYILCTRNIIKKQRLNMRRSM